METAFSPCFENLSPKKADLIILILTSQDIEAAIQKEDTKYRVCVPAGDFDRARRHVETYYKENRKKRLRQAIEHLPLSSFYVPPAFGIMGLLVLIHLAAALYHSHEALVLQYGSSALYILQGQTYRAVTALFLHADAEHLLGNLAGLLIFAAPAISVSGYGTGPFMLLFSGTCGNLINAFFYRTAHLSIGASTSVMGAAGLLAAFQVTHKKNRVSMNTLMPIIAGAVLVSMFSGGENTDIWAHVFGFLSGLISGILFFPLNRTLNFKGKERIFLFLTICIVLGAFILRSG